MSGQRPGGGAPHEEELGHWQGPEQLLEILPGDEGGGVRLFVVAAHFGKDFVKGHPHRHRKAGLGAHPVADGVRHGLSVAAEEVEGAGHIQPALINGERLHQIGKPVIDGVNQLGVMAVFFMVGGKEDQTGAFSLGLPHGLGGLDPEGLGGLVFGQDDPVAAFRVSAHRHGLIPQLRMVQQLHRSVKTVQVAVQNHPVHGGCSGQWRMTDTPFRISASSSPSSCWMVTRSPTSRRTTFWSSLA